MKNRNILSLAIVCLFAVPTSHALTVSRSQMNFGTQEIFTSNARQQFNLTNTNTSRWEQVYGFNFSHKAFSRVQTNCPQWLAPRQSCYWDVSFTPGATGLHSGTLSIWGSMGTGVVNLTGYGNFPVVKKWGPKKWHPGHYAQLAPVGASRYEIDQSMKPQEIKGALMQYDWAKLEPSRGVFNFSQIEADLAYLRARGKRLAILVNDKTFFGNLLECVPPDMKTDPLYKGGQVIRRDNTGAVRGCVSKRWIPAVMDRYIALHRALGARFDREAYVEAVATEESSLSLWTYPTDYSERAYIDQLKRLGTAASQAYPRTLFEIWVNWNLNPPGELVDHLHRYGIGIGGPDTTPLHKTQIVPQFTSMYAGKLPIMMAVQPSFLTWSEQPIAEGKFTLDDVFNFAVTDPKGTNASHLWWWYFVKRWSPGASYDYWDTVALIQKHKAYTNAACPENLICDWQ